MIYIFIGLILLLLLFSSIIFIELKVHLLYDQDEGQIKINWQTLKIIKGQHFLAVRGLCQQFLARAPGPSSSQTGHLQSIGTLQRYRKLAKYAHLSEIKWDTVIGTGDAMYTALIIGSMWPFKGMLIAGITSRGVCEKVSINIQPDFEVKRIYSELDCIFKLRLVHIILIGIHIICLKIRRYINGYTAAGKPQPSH